MRTENPHKFLLSLSPDDRQVFLEYTRAIYLFIVDQIYDRGGLNSETLLTEMTKLPAPEIIKLKLAIDIEKFINMVGQYYFDKCPKHDLIKTVIYGITLQKEIVSTLDNPDKP